MLHHSSIYVCILRRGNIVTVATTSNKRLCDLFFFLLCKCPVCMRPLSVYLSLCYNVFWMAYTRRPKRYNFEMLCTIKRQQQQPNQKRYTCVHCAKHLMCSAVLFVAHFSHVNSLQWQKRFGRWFFFFSKKKERFMSFSNETVKEKEEQRKCFKYRVWCNCHGQKWFISVFSAHFLVPSLSLPFSLGVVVIAPSIIISWNA